MFSILWNNPSKIPDFLTNNCECQTNSKSLVDDNFASLINNLKLKTMNKMLVAVFESENKAYEGLSALKELHNNGDITLYASAVVSKNEKGELHQNTAADQGPIGTSSFSTVYSGTINSRTHF